MYNKIDTIYGTLNSFHQGDMISDFLREYGEWAYLECEFIASVLPKSNNKIFDLGAFLGTFSLGVNNFISDSHFLAAEMNQKCWSALDNNLTKLDNHHVFKGAVAGHNEKNALLSIKTSNSNLGSTHIGKHVNNCVTRTLDTKTIAYLANKFFIPDFIKLDLEGVELAVLKGSQKFIQKYMPIIWVECNEAVNSLHLCEWLLWMHYEVYYYAFPAYNPNNFKSNDHILYPFAYEAGLLGIPDKQPVSLPDSLLKKDCFFKKISSPKDLIDIMWLTPRWGKNEWKDLSKIQLIGIISHLLSGKSVYSFLRS